MSEAHQRKREKIQQARTIDLQKYPEIKDGVIKIEEFIESRKFEINALNKAMKLSKSVLAQRAFQSLPRHLRRRAASHCPSKLPRRLRQRARKELLLDPLKAQKKKPFRKKRFDSKQADFQHRQRNKKWLETHVWHAKRMHMHLMWGYMLAETPTDKSFRPAYRAANNKAVIHDASYLAVFRINGPLTQIKQLLDVCTDPTLPSIASTRYLSNSRMGSNYIYEYDKWPTRLLGPIKYLWTKTNNALSLLLFVHPSIAKHVLQDMKSSMLDRPDLSIDDLRDNFAIFDIAGPLATEVLHNVLHVNAECEQITAEIWQGLYGLHSTNSIGEGYIISLTIDDPRLKSPPKTVSGKCKLEPKLSEVIPKWSSAASRVAFSTLWQDDVRKQLSQIPSKISIDRRKEEKNIVPGMNLTNSKNDPQIPVVLVQSEIPNALSKSTAMPGWLMIAPKSWSLPLWHSLVYTGAFTIGQREKRNQYFEAGLPVFPHDYGGITNAGKEIDYMRELDEKSCWERKPPSKRTNYEKLLVFWPFAAPWDKLVVQDELATTVIEEVPNLWLLRSKSFVEVLSLCTSETAFEKYIRDFVNSQRQKRYKGLKTFDNFNPHHALVQVRLDMKDRGRPMHLTMICDILNEEEYVSVIRMRTHTNSFVEIDEIETDEENEGEIEMDVDVSSRKIIGFVTTGRYSLALGRGQGIGLCSASKLFSLIQTQKGWVETKHQNIYVALRNPTSRIYRYAKLSIIE